MKKQNIYGFDLTLQTLKDKNRSGASLFKFSGDRKQEYFFMWPKRVC